MQSIRPALLLGFLLLAACGGTETATTASLQAQNAAQKQQQMEQLKQQIDQLNQQAEQRLQEQLDTAGQ
ncbi:hypothetical protein OEG79_17915 [Pseudomonas sp. Z8(2022)]|jgi:cell division protein FtsB|uniref:hypothetical protein n=1 Tax=Pseudomonas sp. Z8(2022) TaxID=2962597 RepID=UPI0021F4AA82|nr:hypothetical protein [Pseudomonas sp. Z8(2022)]UYP29903.1 hypothetical protein OEG79_17915 [Pseudomonas sp. Z8(2022)]